jgi:phage gpG-like protein
VSESAFESASGAFEGSLEFFWEVDDDASPSALQAMANRIETLARSLDDMTPVLVGAHQILSDDIREHFEREEGPDGPWKGWAPSYAPKAESENIGILRKSEELFEAATSQNAWFITENDLWYNPNDLPPYWPALNFGRTNGPKMPARPFLWTSEEAGMKVIELFDAWVGDEMNVVLSSRGIAQTHTPRFGPRIGLRTVLPTV